MWHASKVSKVQDESTHSYDKAAPVWGDKMRTLGYFAGYKGFLESCRHGNIRADDIIDVGAGTAAFSQAWVEVFGPPAKTLTLLEPSAAMLERGRAALNSIGFEPQLVQALLGGAELEPADHVLAAHVIEHCPDPLVALKQMNKLLKVGGKLHLVVSKPHWCNVIIWFQWRHRTFGEEEIKGLVEEAGFEVETTYAFPSGPPSRTSRGLVARKSG